MSLILKNICKSFGDKIVLNDLSYTFPNNGIFAITGPSGSGKTTLLRITCGLEKNYSGEVIGGGTANTAVAFQEYRLFPSLTAVQNVSVPNEKDGVDISNEAKDILIKLGFGKDDLSLLPGELSGGMKQRVSIARALLREAPILILDEPTKELDPSIVSILHEMIANESKKRLVLFVSHNQRDAQLLGATPIVIEENTKQKYKM